MKIIPERLYRKVRYRKGHGVHSPFAYNLITNIVEEKFPYYIFEDIERCRTELIDSKEKVEFLSQRGNIKKKTVGEITTKETQSCQYGALLFRLVNFFQCKNILQIGASTGVMSLYLASSGKDIRCYALEDRECLIPVIKKTQKGLNINNIQIEHGEYLSAIDNILEKQDNFDLIFLNTMRNPELSKKILDKHINTKILVMDGIRKNKKTKFLWQIITDNPNARITIDLYYLGIALFDGKFYKKDYKAHFDNGKKQNIYENRRQRFNFFNWRKKNLEKRSTP